jgi:tetratricopeptide (TPR) repeat protein
VVLPFLDLSPQKDQEYFSDGLTEEIGPFGGNQSLGHDLSGRNDEVFGQVGVRIGHAGSGYTHHWYAHSLEAQGRLPEAMREMRAALDLDPLDIPINWDVASELLWSGRYEEALQLARKAGDLFPSVSVFQYMETEAEYGKADWQAAHSTVEKLRKKSPELAADPVFMSMFGVDAARQGRRAEATAILDRLETLRLKQYVEPFLAIELCSALKDDGRLRLWLQRADQERSSMFVYLPMYRDLWAFESKALAQIADRR